MSLLHGLQFQPLPAFAAPPAAAAASGDADAGVRRAPAASEDADPAYAAPPANATPPPASAALQQPRKMLTEAGGEAETGDMAADATEAARVSDA